MGVTLSRLPAGAVLCEMSPHARSRLGRPRAALFVSDDALDAGADGAERRGGGRRRRDGGALRALLVSHLRVSAAQRSWAARCGGFHAGVLRRANFGGCAAGGAARARHAAIISPRGAAATAGGRRPPPR